MGGPGLTYLFAAAGASALAIVAAARSSRSPVLWPFVATASAVAVWNVVQGLSLSTRTEPWTLLSPAVAPLPLAAFTSLALRASEVPARLGRALERTVVGLGLAFSGLTLSALLLAPVRTFVASTRWDVCQLAYTAICLVVSAGALALGTLRGAGQRRARSVDLAIAGVVGMAGAVSELVPLGDPLRLAAAASIVALAVAAVGAVTRPLLAETIALREVLVTFGIVAAIGAVAVIVGGRGHAGIPVALGVAGAGLVALWGYRAAAGRWQRRLEDSARLAALGRAASVLAHEVRNPLTTVQGAIDVLEEELRREGRGGEPARYLDAVRAETARVLALVEDCLAFARPAAPSPERFDLAALVARAVALAAIRFPRARLELAPSGTPLSAVGDSGQLLRLVENLLANACQAAEAPTVRVEARVDASAAIVAVEDDGPGVPPELREDVFQPFFTTKARGGGLGLAIAREIARRHGGELSVTEGARGGARFVARWPREPRTWTRREA